MEKVIFESDALAGWCGGSWDPQPPESVQGINHDTRNCDEGNLYVALRGDRFDGHDFIADAEVRGACGAVVSESWRREGVTFPVLRVTETAVA